MKIVIVGDSCEALVLGNIYRRAGADVKHFIPTPRYLKYDVRREYNIEMEHYYPEDKQNFSLTKITKDHYVPTFIREMTEAPDILVFAGCYDQVVTALKKLTAYKSHFPRTKYLIQIKNWKSVEYLQTIVQANFTAWLTPMVEAYFNNDDERHIRAGFIRKVGIHFHKCEYEAKKSFAEEMSKFLNIDIFEVSDTIHINRIVISLYTPIVLYMTRYMELHWRNQTKVLKYLHKYYVETQPFILEYITDNNEFTSNMIPYMNLYRNNNDQFGDLQGLITKMGSQKVSGLFQIMIRAALINKYSNDEAIDLATEMIRWLRYFNASIAPLLSLFDENREIWEFVDVRTKLIEAQKKEAKTLILDKPENK